MPLLGEFGHSNAQCCIDQRVCAISAVAKGWQLAPCYSGLLD